MMQSKAFQLELKELNEETGQFKGLAAVYGNVDRQGDIIEQGAFTKTIQENSTVPVLWQHKTDMPIGIGRLEDAHDGLTIEGALNLQVEKGREALALLKQGALKGLSIGYDAVQKEWKGQNRHLKEIRLWEVSLVTIPANPKATVSMVKEYKGVPPFQNLPLSSKKEWDADKAIARVREWAGAKGAPTDEYCQAFLYVNPDEPASFESYRLPIADVEDGKLVVVPGAIEAAAAAITAGKSGVPDDALASVKEHLKQYQEKLGQQTPPAGTKELNLERLLRRVIPTAALEAAEVKAGRVISSANIALLQSAIDALQAVLNAAQPKPDGMGKPKGTPPPGTSGAEDPDFSALLQEMREFATSH